MGIKDISTNEEVESYSEQKYIIQNKTFSQTLF